MQLMPLLLASSLPARVVSVFGPSRDQTIDFSDLSLRDPKKFGFMPMGSHAAYFKTFFFERLAQENPDKLSLTHYYPGLVWSEGFNEPSYPWWLKLLCRYILPALPFLWTSADEVGQRVLFHLSERYPARSKDLVRGEVKESKEFGVASSSDGIVGGGAYRVNFKSEEVGLNKKYPSLREKGLAEISWKHTMDAFSEIEAGRKFTG